MSKLHAPAIDRLKASGTDGEGLMKIMEEMARMSEDLGQEAMTTLVSYIDNGDEFVEGTWVPELWIVVRKVMSNEAGQTATTPTQESSAMGTSGEVDDKAEEPTGDPPEIAP